MLCLVFEVKASVVTDNCHRGYGGEHETLLGFVVSRNGGMA
jgi:hypothetical protein